MVLLDNPKFHTFTSLHTHLRERHPLDQHALMKAIIPNSKEIVFMSYLHDCLGLRGAAAAKYTIMCMERESGPDGGLLRPAPTPEQQTIQLRNLMSRHQTAGLQKHAVAHQHQTMDRLTNALIPQIQPMELLQQELTPKQKHVELQSELSIPQQLPLELPQEVLAPSDIPVGERVAFSKDKEAIYLEWYGNKCCPLCNTGTPMVLRGVDPRYKSYTTLHNHLFEKHTTEQQALLNDLVPNSNSDEFKTFIYEFLALNGAAAKKYTLWSVERETNIAAGSSF
jgi:hypothetical protein